jgi:hypothetical protein
MQLVQLSKQATAAAAPAARRSAGRPAAPAAAFSSAPCRSRVVARAASSSEGGGGGDNPVRAALSGLASGIYKATASFQQVDSSLPPLWQGACCVVLVQLQQLAAMITPRPPPP